MPRKKKSKNYFTLNTQDAIIKYNLETDPIYRNKIYNDHIRYPFEKLAENVLNTFKFQYFDIPASDVKREVVSALIEKIHMYKEGKGKAFSYFTIIAKHYLIYHNNTNYKRWQQNSLISNMPESWNPDDGHDDKEMATEYIEFKDLMLSYWDTKLTEVFIKKRDLQIADAVLELFRRSQHIENFNKKHLYLLIREMTGYKTHYITKVVNTMKDHQQKILNSYLDRGELDYDEEDKYWEY